MYVIGTAGHVDHGKSTLVKALTGIDPDRLQEEKAREMTIDLGFAWLTLPSGREVSVVDVPGHERFIKNMLAGVGGLDAALLVIDADEGPMPQTEEHLDILHLLGVDKGIVVLTKSDLVDAEWLALMEEEMREHLKGTTLQDALILPVSARTGNGLDRLKAEVDILLQGTHTRADRGRPRLPVDRAFSIPGFGTVVTGTLLDGSFHVGQEVVFVPSGIKSRIRGLQSHKHKVERIEPGNRVAVNLTGLELDDLWRGMVVTTPNWLNATNRVDVHVSLLADAPVPLRQNSLLDFFTGATETPARITLLDTERLEPGQSGWAQLRLRDEVAVAKGDRYIIRRPSPSLTIGGGQVVDAHPRRHKRFHAPTLQTLQTLQRGTPEELLLEALGKDALDVKVIAEKLGLSQSDAAQALTMLVNEGRVVQLTSSLLMAAPGWDDLMARAQTLLGHYHRQQPLKRGMSKEELRSRLAQATQGSPRAFPHAMSLGVARGLIAEDPTTYRLTTHEPTYSSAQQQQVARLKQAYITSPYSPPSPTELEIEPDVLSAMVDAGELIKIDNNIYYTPQAYGEMRDTIIQALDNQGEINVASMRDLFGTTRKYAIPFLEHLDEQKLTRRVGDVRVKW